MDISLHTMYLWNFNHMGAPKRFQEWGSETWNFLHWLSTLLLFTATKTLGYGLLQKSWSLGKKLLTIKHLRWMFSVLEWSYGNCGMSMFLLTMMWFYTNNISFKKMLALRSSMNNLIWIPCKRKWNKKKILPLDNQKRKYSVMKIFPSWLDFAGRLILNQDLSFLKSASFWLS